MEFIDLATLFGSFDKVASVHIHGDGRYADIDVAGVISDDQPSSRVHLITYARILAHELSCEHEYKDIHECYGGDYWFGITIRFWYKCPIDQFNIYAFTDVARKLWSRVPTEKVFHDVNDIHKCD